MRAFVVWEPVLFTDWRRPTTGALARVGDARASQFWDKERVISHLLGEGTRRGIVWDYVAVFPPGAVWKGKPPEPLYSGGPVVRVTEPARKALAEALRRVERPARYVAPDTSAWRDKATSHAGKRPRS